MRYIIVGAVVATFAATSAHAAIIDTFETSQSAIADGDNPNVQTVATGPGILGDERELFAFWDSGPNEIQEVANASNDGLLNFSMGADTLGAGVVVWDGVEPRGGPVTVNPTGLGGVDLTEGGTHDRLGISVVFDDLAAELMFRVYTDADNWSQATLPLPGGIFATQDFDLLYSSFVAMGSGPADFANVGAITMMISSQLPATDVQIDFIETETPAPGTFALAGLAGLFASRRRR